MTITWRRTTSLAILLLLIPLLAACGGNGPGSGDETLASFALSAPSSVTATEPFGLSVDAVGSEGTAPFQEFDGSVGLSVSSGTISPSSIELSNGTAEVDATLTDATGDVTVTASNGEATGSIIVNVGQEELRELPGEPQDSAAEAVPVREFQARPEDYANDAPDLGDVYVSFNTLLMAFELGTTVAEANDVLTDIEALIVGGIPGVAGEAAGILIVRVPTSSHEEMISLIERLRQDVRVQHAVRDALLETTELPQPNGGNPPSWTWESTPTGGNFGLELTRVPQMWNLNGAVEKAGGSAVTGVLDVGFADDHEDLTYDENQTPGNPATHGTHVAGTIAADYDDGVGVDGVNPFADLVVRTRDSSLIGGSSTLDVRESFGEAHIFGFFDLVRSRPELRAVNISLGYNWGPAGVDQDSNTTAQDLVEQQGALFGLAQILTVWFNDDFDDLGDLPLVAVAAGNDSNSGFGTQQARWSSPFAFAGLGFDFENILVVESVANDPGGTGGATRSDFSNIDADLSAPGTDVLSTVLGDGYATLSGTSMAAPHATGLVGYLAALDASLTHAELREVLTANAVAVGGGASDRMDAFASVLDVDRVQGTDRVLRMLLDIDDGTPDGNQRLFAGSSSDFTGEDADGDGGIGDDSIDMSDFRRFRDWLLQVEEPAGLDLDGSADHPKKDVNGNGEVGSASDENLFPRGDFNGDGELSRTATSYVPGAVDATVSDLDVLQLAFSDPNYDASDLDPLLDSGDIEVWPRRCLDRSDVVEVESWLSQEGTTLESRSHAGASAPRQVYTAPVPAEADGYTAHLEALDGSNNVVFEAQAFFTVAPGSDAHWDPVCSEETPEPPDGPGGESWGDPHQITFDGLKYDFQSVGEFVFVTSSSGDRVIQVRQEPWGSSDRVSVNTAVATDVDGSRVGVYAGQDFPLLIEGTPTAVSDGGSTSIGNGAVFRDGSSYTIVYPNDEQVRVHLRPGRMDIRVNLNSGRAGNVAGLLGNADGDLGNEFARRDGTVFTQPISYEDFYTDTNTFDESWRISAEESLFDYDPGEDTATFTDTNLPVAYASTGDLSPNAYETARSACEEAGVTDPIVLDACILDVGVTGDPDFAADSAAAGSPTSSMEVTPQTRDVALLHGQDTSAANAYETGLEARGFEVSLVLIGSTESANASTLDAYDLLMIDTFTGNLSNWDGGEKVVNAIQQSGRPVIGLGEGGYAYLGQVSSSIGYPNGRHGNGLDGFSPFAPQHPSLAGPRGVDTGGGKVAVSTSPMSYADIFIDDVPTTVERVGDTSDTHSVVVADTAAAGSALWGFHGLPSDYTSDGWNALANLANYLIGLN